MRLAVARPDAPVLASVRAQPTAGGGMAGARAEDAAASVVVASSSISVSVQ